MPEQAKQAAKAGAKRVPKGPPTELVPGASTPRMDDPRARRSS